MKVAIRLTSAFVLLISSGLFFSFSGSDTGQTSPGFPFQQAGLTERQAAAHLLGRFTYGAKPGDVDAVVNRGLEKWFDQQLDGGLKDDDLTRRLSVYDALQLSNSEVVKQYPKAGNVRKMAVKNGMLDNTSLDKTDKEAYKRALAQYMRQEGLKPQRELFRQFINQKVLRAAYSNNQVQEVLTEFWFNHFNVSLTKNTCAEFIPAYERDVIRPNVLGKFEDLVLATAQSPAMLTYLDNFSSAGANTGKNMQATERMRKRFASAIEKNEGDSANSGVLTKIKQGKKAQGLNENYAREVMELHTLGVDGGYTQKDVTEAARVLTGWTIYPMSDYGAANVIKKAIDRVGEDKLEQFGFVHNGDFLFAANRHDNGEKTVLGQTFKNNGYQEGVQLLKMISNHPSAAAFICKKIAVRFVSDNPPQTLLAKMSKTFSATGGDIRQVIKTMVSSPEFWSKEAVREKTKSPFELAISSIRSLNADITMPYQLYTWIEKMGQKMYFYQAPTGFPDRGQYWINSGALLNRMNFGLALSANKIPGVRIDLLALNKGHEPESAEAALITYSKIVMPERELGETIKRLNPLLHDPELEQKVNQAADKTPVAAMSAMERNEDADVSMGDDQTLPGAGKKKNGKNDTGSNANMMSQVVGIIIGSPEFQRR